jgi:hypothetical protein
MRTGRCTKSFGGRNPRTGITERPRCRRADNVKIDFQERGWQVFDSIYLFLDIDKGQTVVNRIINHSYP